MAWLIVAGVEVVGGLPEKLGRRKVKTSWCLGVVRVTGVSSSSSNEVFVPGVVLEASG